MDDDFFAFDRLSDCERVESILQDGIVVESDNRTSFYLWRAKSHASTCDSCQQSHPSVLVSLAGMITQAETALALEIDEIRGEHMREASEIARRAILSRPAGSTFALDELLLTDFSRWPEERSGQEDTQLALIRSLAKAGGRVKEVFSAVHGFGLVWFNVVPNLDDGEQEFARKECAGLVRQLSAESREFSFSAALAAELFPLAWDPDSEPPLGVHLGVLYKVVQAAACGYVEAYLQSLEDSTLQPSDLGAQRQPDMTELSRGSTAESGAENIESLYGAQTMLMDVQSGLMERMTRLEESFSRKAPEAIERECVGALRSGLGSRFDELTKETQSFLLAAEFNYTHPRNDLDFTAVVFFLTKAFEVEFRRRVIEPLINDLQPLTIRDSSFREDLSTFTLGNFLALFKKYSRKTEPLFERLGLQHKNVCDAVWRVNREKDVKHKGTRNEAEAMKFRAAFLGKESVLNALFPRRSR